MEVTTNGKEEDNSSSDSSEEGSDNEEVVLFPLKSDDEAVKILRISRVAKGELDKDRVQHIAGGPYKGIVISKAKQELPCTETPHAVRKFLVHVQDVKAAAYHEIRERRQVFMWFKPDAENADIEADLLFECLTNKEHFPKDYISFVKKLIVLVRNCETLQMLELKMSPVPDVAESPLSPGYQHVFTKPFLKQNAIDRNSTDDKHDDDSAFANPGSPLGIDNLKHTDHREEVIREENNSRGLHIPRTSQTRIWSTFSDDDPPASTAEDPALTESVEHILTKEDPLHRVQDEFRTEQDPELLENESYNAREGDSRLMGPESLLRKKQPKKPTESEESQEPSLSESELVHVRQQILVVLEDAFPSALKVDEIAGIIDVSIHQTMAILMSFQEKGLAQQLDNKRWIRVATIKRKRKPQRQSGNYMARTSYMRGSMSSQNDFQLVPQMPVLTDREQPSIAIITLLFCEKQAVDAMMSNKITYVRYKTEGSGENQVYTIGTIGCHRVVSTKLARVGSGQGATVSAGNTTTRLLGGFGKINHVFMVGVGGSVPSYDNDTDHVRCGDVVISKPEFPGSPTYIYVTDVTTDSSGDASFGTQFWESKDETISNIIGNIAQGYGPHSMINSTLAQEIQSGLVELEGQELSFSRPDADTDRLYRIDSDGAWGEVPHPVPAPQSPRLMYPDRPLIHFGSVGSGYDLLVKGKNDWRREFALFNDIKALDSGFQAVMESIEGNRKDSFWLVRGISDYMDGMASTEWQPYAALVAAAATKMILMRIPKE